MGGCPWVHVGCSWLAGGVVGWAVPGGSGRAGRRACLAGQGGQGGGGEVAGGDGLEQVVHGGGEPPFGGGFGFAAHAELAEAHVVLDLAVRGLGDVAAVAVGGDAVVGGQPGGHGGHGLAVPGHPGGPGGGRGGALPVAGPAV